MSADGSLTIQLGTASPNVSVVRNLLCQEAWGEYRCLFPWPFCQFDVLYQFDLPLCFDILFHGVVDRNTRSRFSQRLMSKGIFRLRGFISL